jgi:hypothetical protein
MTDHPNQARTTWETACRCGMRYCRSGWPEDAPLPRDLDNPRAYLAERLAEERSGCLAGEKSGR